MLYDDEAYSWVRVQVPREDFQTLKRQAAELETTLQGLVRAKLIEMARPGSDMPLPRDRRRKP